MVVGATVLVAALITFFVPRWGAESLTLFDRGFAITRRGRTAAVDLSEVERFTFHAIPSYSNGRYRGIMRRLTLRS
jgi:hypothetical protein